MDVANGYYLVQFQSKIWENLLPNKFLSMAKYNEWSSRHYLRCDRSSHGGGENFTSLTINESVPVKTVEVPVTMGKAFGPWMVVDFILTGYGGVSYRYGGVIRFKKGVFIGNLKDKGLGLQNGSMIGKIFAEGISGHGGATGAEKQTRSLRDKNAG
ncbi:hypothetical protein GOBAR_AA23368 [Gossypium barbadense]|uniref:Uncharacterized protein n=1 Tax=Gossypium barbadense TaxID=3634 RepID=A0A2P5X1U5_GOSBA|nr:hypothetical protein GOBAR_AA23368 [Gossypium barbadense]